MGLEDPRWMSDAENTHQMDWQPCDGGAKTLRFWTWERAQVLIDKQMYKKEAIISSRKRQEKFY